MAATEAEKSYCRDVLASKAVSALARSAVKEVLLRLGLPHAVDDGILVMAELVNNAVAVSPVGGTIRLFAGPRAEGVAVAVWDCAERMPERRPPTDALDLRPENFDRNGGWGLGLVEALARECWIERTCPGKWVCAALHV